MRAVVPAEFADDLVGRIGLDILGVEIVSGDGGTVRVDVYVDDPPRAREIRDAVVDALRSLDAAAGCDPPILAEVADGRWVETYQSGLRPLPLGRRFVIVPGEATTDLPPDREPIFLTPGRAFGTGEHPTTRMCADALEREVDGGSRWLDLGTGSGVLAWVAARCGAARVRAVDVDPEAIEVARQGIARNGGHPAIDLAVGSASDEADGAFDGVVANISERYFFAEAGQLARVVRPGGVLVASGFLSRDAGAVERGLVQAGFVVVRRAADGPWSSCVAARTGG